MKKFKSGALKKLMLSFGLFFGLMLFGQTSFAQSVGAIDARIAKLGTLQVEHSDSPSKIAIIGEVITELNVAKTALGSDDDYHLDNAIFDKVKPAVLADYSETELQTMLSRKAELESEGVGTDSREYYKLSLILKANGMN